MTHYNYWIVRYVPDPVRGEFVNLGILVGRDGFDWHFKAVSSLRRANRLGGDPTIAGYWLRELARMTASLNNAQRADPEPILAAVADSGDISAAIVSRLAGRLNNAVQISPPYPIVAKSAADGVDMLFDHLVADPQVQTRSVYGTRVSSYFAQEFRRSLPDGARAIVQPKPHVIVGSAPRTASFAVTDSRVEQITNAWSFNLSDVDLVSTQIQAWAGHMGRLRRRGGTLEAKGQPTLVIPNDVQLRVVYEEPQSEPGRAALRIAQDVWSDIDQMVAYPNANRERLVTDALAAVAA